MKLSTRPLSVSLLALVACQTPVSPKPAAGPEPAVVQTRSTSAAIPASTSRWNYPPTKTVDASDTYFGVTYKDPFRLLENLKDADTQAWFRAQANYTNAALDAIPGRDALIAEWTAIDKQSPPKYKNLDVDAGVLFYKKTLAGENVGKLYTRRGWAGAEELLFDPATYRSAVFDGSSPVTLESFTSSWDGRRLVLALSSGGSEYSELRVFDVAKKALLADSIYPSQGAFSWTPDGRSFLYDACADTDIHSDKIELDRHTNRHTLGAPVSSDITVFGQAANPELGIQPKEFASAWVSEFAPGYLIGGAYTVQREAEMFAAPISQLGHGKANFAPIVRRTDNVIGGLTFCGDDSICGVTHTGAPHNKLVRTSLRHPDWAHAETLVPEAADTLQYAARSKDFLFLEYSNGITGRIVQMGLHSKETHDVPLPASGDVSVRCPDAKSNRCVVVIEGWKTPATTYELDGDARQVTRRIFDSPAPYQGLENLVTEEVEIPGHDGTMIPLSILHEKGMPMDGSQSAILEGYGSYSISFTPWFRERNSVALHGVVLAWAHVRGGGEKGEEWYRAGYKTTKPNTWKDFISAAEYLVAKGYTSKEKLAGTGTSAGGILISRAITERPDLFAAAVCNVGVANAMRAEFSPNGPVNTPEFGTVTDRVEAAALYEMDGMQHVKQGVKYPALLGVAGWNDPRVSPWDTGKFVAAVQAASTSGKPALLKVNYDDGHFTEEKSVTYQNFASQYAFMLWQTGHAEFQPKSDAVTPR